MIRQLTCFITHSENMQINFNLCSICQERKKTLIRSGFLVIRQLSVSSPKLKKNTNKHKSMSHMSRKDNTSIRSGFLVIRQLSCIIAQHYIDLC